MPVLVGFVPTPEGRAALRRAVLECGLRRARLVVVNSEYRSIDATETDPTAAEVRSACADLGVSEPEFEVRRLQNAYEPADHVLAVAEEVEAELIVIGLRKRTAVGKLILGGSAQRILLDAACPVLAVKVDQSASPLSTLTTSIQQPAQNSAQKPGQTSGQTSGQDVVSVQDGGVTLQERA